MLSNRRAGPSRAGFGLMMSVLLLGMACDPVRAVTAAGGPLRHVAEGRVSARRFIASPARPVGYDAQVAAQPDPARYVGLIEAGRADSLRDDVTWAFAEPARGRFDWSVPDELVTQAAEHHLHALLTVDTSPLWASGGSASNRQWPWLPPRRPAAYGVFAAAVAARYGPGGMFWREHPQLPGYLPAGIELWNEENLTLFWGGRIPDPRQYAAMVTAAYSRIKRADPTMTVVLGGLAPAGAYDDVKCSGHAGTGHDAGAWNGINYLQALYADGIHGHFDAVAWHPYYFFKDATAAQMLAYNRCSAWSQITATPVSLRSVMAAHGDGAKRVWITEAGVPTCAGDAAYICVSPAQQAGLASAESRLWQTLSWAGGFYWYDIRDNSADTQRAASHFGTVTSDDVPKPAYRALQQAWKPAVHQKGPVMLPIPGSRGVRSVAFSPDGRFLAAGDGNGHLYVWQMSTLSLASSLADPGSKGISSVAFNPQSSLLAAGDANGHIYLWAGSKLHAALAVPSGKAIRSLAFSRDGNYLAAGDADGHVYVWHMSTLSLASSMADPGSNGVTSVAFNPADTLLAAADANGHVYLWAHGLAATLADPSSRGVNSVTFSANGKYLAAGDANGKTYVWLISKGAIAQTLADTTGKSINTVAYNPGATLLATGDPHGHINLWTPAPELASTLTDPRSDGVPAVAFSPNGKYLAAADANGHVYLWTP